MKIHLQFFVAAVCLVVLNACATSPAGGSAPLAGTWTNSFGAVWTIKPNGTFEVDRNHDGKIDIRGSYRIRGDTLTIERIEGKIQKGCEGPGVYKFNRSGRNLSFTLVSDKCKDRKKNVLSPWHMK